MDNNKIAIIIPAYKANYLEQTLNSFVNQTNKNFSVYIGNDNSPHDIDSIVSKFISKLNIIYHKFDDNLGSISLTKQWERCIDLSNEKWIWLFSDDDLVSSDCIQKFYDFRDDENKFYKFHTKIINGKNEDVFKKTDKINNYKEYITSTEFIANRIKCKGFRSFAVEYVFSRELYNKIKFIDFPLAWASDDASWITYSLNSGRIKCIPAVVSWRASDFNISLSTVNSKVNNQKIEASIKYCVWLKSTLNNKINDNDISYWFCMQIASISYQINFKKLKKMIDSIGLHISSFELIKHYLIIRFYHVRNYTARIIKLIIKA